MLKRASWAVVWMLLLAGCGADYGVDQHGQKVAADALDKRWLVVNYWAEWCGPCRQEVSELSTLAKQLGSTNVRVIGVNFDNLQGDELLKSSQAMGIGYTVLAANPAEHFGFPESEGLPITYLVDPEGKVREQLLGQQTAAGLKAALKAVGALQR
ncbi:TlpA disulfide reductase family protein [Pseudomonas sp. dw_358]|uniref:TlpA disulfide reductase family protein n=1 Tax=Pseudomonas sp. dw_358 TaxID=2720083 RepID=UPI001BD45F87|nr:TlpA disulfide reductase family protein [Pseudomonas sp. dw_358]